MAIGPVHIGSSGLKALCVGAGTTLLLLRVKP